MYFHFSQWKQKKKKNAIKMKKRREAGKVKNNDFNSKHNNDISIFLFSGKESIILKRFFLKTF